MIISRTVTIFCLLLIFSSSRAQKVIPPKTIIKTNELQNYLKQDVKDKIAIDNIISEKNLAEYLREKFSERYYYNWRNTEQRFKAYEQIYNSQLGHKRRAEDHMAKFADSTQWILPFDYLNGGEVNAYALRHLARQHKMVDIAFQYYYEQKDPRYIDYFEKQMKSLNSALEAGEYEKIKNGNGVYEAFRAGYRVLNWLSVHNMFLGEEAYTDKDQLVTISTLLQHGAFLYESNPKFHPGNHQTRGMSALAMLSILLRDFEGTELWYKHAMKILEEQLIKEINNDGFQFERSVHYHMSDIKNFFYVYQLAQISSIEVSDSWEEKLYSLFTTLVKIAYPDKSAPVLQDDTEIPWGEKNEISETLTLGYLLFEDPVLGYFAVNSVEQKMCWFIQDAQFDLLHSVQKKTPPYKSLHFPETKYYIMREGWNKNDKMMIISAGVDDKKPDHQHGDILGIQAMANEQVILPNYQVRYPLEDYEFFKNSMVKNVALVDNELQGKEYKGNKGGSGFGKFHNLPEPKTIAWKTEESFDFFAGSHNGFDNIDVAYSRQVIYIKNDFWIVKDNFNSDELHSFKQVWQGHYTTEEGPNLIRSTFANASGCDIFQLNKTDEFYTSGKRGKEWTVITKNGLTDFSFITVVYPYRGYNNRLNEKNDAPELHGWNINKLNFEAEGNNLHSLSKNEKSVLLNVENIQAKGIQLKFTPATDVFVEIEKDNVTIHALGCKKTKVNITGSKSIQIDDVIAESETEFKPGSIIVCE